MTDTDTHTHKEEPRSWEDELQFTIMEPYLFLAEMKPHAKDSKAHMEEMRHHWEKLKSFISTREKEARGEIEKLKRLNAHLEDGSLQERDNYFYNLALADLIKRLTNKTEI